MDRKVRPSLDEYFLKIAKVVSERSTCVRNGRHVGAVAVKDKFILSTGYNGAAANTKDCIELGCLRDQKNIKSGHEQQVCRAIHAEQNVIIQAALHGVNIEGATIYCTHSPCIICAKMLVNAKIKEFVCYTYYPDPAFEELFKEAGVKFRTINEPGFSTEEIGERVLAIDTETFEKAGFFTGFKPMENNSFYLDIREKVKFVVRDDAEVNDRLKQIIPYILVHHKDRYLVLRRLSKGGEKRLHDAYTFGVGGHINPIDSGGTPDDNMDIIERGMIREMNEEIETPDLKGIKLVGFVYDDNQDVSRHHIGFVYDAEIGSENVKVLETEKLEPYFVDKKDMTQYLNGKESWAEIVYENYIDKKVKITK